MSTAHTGRLKQFNQMRRFARIIGYHRSVWVTRDAVSVRWQRFDTPVERLLKSAGMTMPARLSTMSGGPPPGVAERWAVEPPTEPDQKYMGIDISHGPDQSGIVLGEVHGEKLYLTPLASSRVRKPSIDDLTTALSIFHIENDFRSVQASVVDRTRLCWLLDEEQRNTLIEKVSVNLINEFRHLEGV